MPFVQADGEQKKNIALQSLYRSLPRSLTDTDGIHHAVDVDSDSLYEAVALAVAEFYRDDVTPNKPGIGTEFLVTAYRKPTEHRIKLHQVEQWAKPRTQGGPATTLKRERVRALLGKPV